MYLLNYNPNHEKLPPGPRKLPIIGNLHQLTAAGSLPHRSLTELAKKHGPIMHLKLGENPSVVISYPELAMDIIKTHDVCFQTRPHPLVSESLTFGSSDIAFAPCGDMWRQLRKICTTELLSVKRVQSFSHIRDEESAKLIESVCIGKIPEDKNEIEEFISLTRKVTEMASGFYLADLFPSVKPLYYLTGMKSKVGKLQNKLEKIFDNIIMEHQHKKKKQDAKEEEDLVDVLLRFHQNRSTNHQLHITTGTIKAVLLVSFRIQEVRVMGV
ncbi:hypothetical protein PIB30_095966 [Stylosanthes scabra]|uniref:Cytochrome P450 n=1 Tax=Stylosanthes scabra TaxID=79078 RepID=A0ABU6QW36_9FABA|nr:hypothetical protein [Stylosanthes scabra]